MKVIKKVPMRFAVGLVLVLMLVWTANSVYNYLAADRIGAELGEDFGRLVGSAAGSFRGITDGNANGYSDGTEAGLAAEDITVEVRKAMAALSKLEVLIAETTLYDVHSVGEHYKAVYELPGRGVFTVDLNASNIIIDEQKNLVSIIIPEPEFDFYTNETEVRQIAETEKFSLQIGAKDGAEAYSKTVNKLKGEAEAYLLNYDLLAQTAKTAAKTQVETMVSAIVGGSRTVYVYFR